MSSSIEAFVTDVRLILELNPCCNADTVLRRAGQRMVFHNMYVGTDAEPFLINLIFHKTPFKTMEAGINKHKEWIGC